MIETGLAAIVAIALSGVAEPEGGPMSEVSLEAGLVAHWRLDDDSKDGSGNGHDGENRGVMFAEDAAQFDGRAAHIVVPDSPALRLGESDFAVAAWVRTEDALDDVLGDIIGKYDPVSRKGLNLCIQNFHGVTSCQANYRNILFGVDGGAEPGEWRDCGRPGDCLMVWALCVYEGDLYAGTFETGKDQSGHVYRHDGGAGWIDCGSPYPSNAVTALAAWDGKLYAAASHYRSSGSALPESENTVPGGRVFRYEGGTKWSDCGRIAEIEGIGGLSVYRGQLYACSLVAPPGLFRYEGGQTWTDCGNPGGRVEALAVHNGSIFGSGWDAHHAGVYRYDADGTWTDCGTPPGTTQTYSFAIHRGRMYIGTWPGGKAFRYAGDANWDDCGQLGDEREVMGMAVYNGKLYAGTLPLAEVHRYDGDDRWTSTGQLDTTPDVKYRRAWSMAVYRGQLFCGTLPSGHVYAMRAGQCVTWDRELAPGWRHVAAIRRAGMLELFVDGTPVAEEDVPGAGGLDVSNEAPLTIGFGAHDYFQGAMKDVRVYDRALSAEEVAALAE